jgi:SAM-dependent methyltransferase
MIGPERSSSVAAARAALARELVSADASYAWLEARQLDVEKWPGVDHRKYVGNFGLQGLHQFLLLLESGLREACTLLDVGCGSLALGRFAIPFLNVGNYVGIEPNTWLLREGLMHETGLDILSTKRPQFIIRDDYAAREVRPMDYDFVIAHSVFTHASVSHVRRALTKLGEVMMGTSVLLMTVVLDDERPSTTAPDWTYPLCVSHTRSDLETLVVELGFSVSWLAVSYPCTVKYVCPNGEPRETLQSWLKLTRTPAVP